MKILVTGAAGYIGSVVTEVLLDAGHQVIALDNLKHGYRQAVHPAALFVLGDLLDERSLKNLLLTNPVDAVVHLAAEAAIDESLRDPGCFFRTNVCGGLNLLEAMAASGVQRLIFSSTAALYGQPEQIPITEDSPLRPVNSYGESKLAFERMLSWYQTAYGLRHISFRYFNACGASVHCGEARRHETHLIPLLFEVALGQRKALSLFGTDYDTPDGSCVRDYVHVVDIASAHLLALSKLDEIKADAFNLGSGTGYTNLQVIQAVQRVTGRMLNVIPAARRPGDPARLVASTTRACLELGWHRKYQKLEEMVQTAWDWRLAHPQGYSQ